VAGTAHDEQRLLRRSHVPEAFYFETFDFREVY